MSDPRPIEIQLMAKVLIERAKKVGYVDKFPRYPKRESAPLINGFLHRLHNWENGLKKAEYQRMVDEKAGTFKSLANIEYANSKIRRSIIRTA